MKIRTKYKQADYVAGALPKEVMMKVVVKPKLYGDIESRLSKAVGEKKTRVSAKSPAYHAFNGRGNGLKKFIQDDEKNLGPNNYPSANDIDEKKFREIQDEFLANPD